MRHRAKILFALLLAPLAACANRESSRSTGMPAKDDCKIEMRVGTENCRPMSKRPLISVPASFFDKPVLVGATIQKVENRDNDSLGRLRLSSLKATWARARIVTHPISKTKPTQQQLLIQECENECSANHELKDELTRIPIEKIEKTRSKESLIFLNPSDLERALDLVEILTKQHRMSVTTKKSNAVTPNDVRMELLDSTLFFDLEDHRILPANSVIARSEVPFKIVSRWFFKKMPMRQAHFPLRPPNGVVGFSVTRGPKPSIHRVDVSNAKRLIKYYVKGVPEDRKKAIAQAFENWNETFKDLTGRAVFTYEFVSSDRADIDTIQAGDVRFNVVEWDNENVADYGGRSSTIVNPFDGRILSGSVLIQGPVIEARYRSWFDGVQPAKTAGMKSRIRNKHDLDFYGKPPSVSYDEYMNGYFTSLLTHELGHNLGLTHNFKGTLAADQYQVSSSVMDYTSAEFTHERKIGPYDTMAIAYGYLGREPDVTDGYCGDADQADRFSLTDSAECSANDATADPFGYFEGLLRQAVQRLIDIESDDLPEYWSYSERLEQTLIGMIAYATSAEKHSKNWIRFFNGHRPREVGEIQRYVVARIENVACSPDTENSISMVVDEKRRRKLESNRLEIQKTAWRVLAAFDPALISPCRINQESL